MTTSPPTKMTPCPACGEVGESDFEETYLTCPECGHEWEVFPDPTALTRTELLAAVQSLQEQLASMKWRSLLVAVARAIGSTSMVLSELPGEVKKRIKQDNDALTKARALVQLLQGENAYLRQQLKKHEAVDPVLAQCSPADLLPLVQRSNIDLAASWDAWRPDLNAATTDVDGKPPGLTTAVVRTGKQASAFYVPQLKQQQALLTFLRLLPAPPQNLSDEELYALRDRFPQANMWVRACISAATLHVLELGDGTVLLPDGSRHVIDPGTQVRDTDENPRPSERHP